LAKDREQTTSMLTVGAAVAANLVLAGLLAVTSQIATNIQHNPTRTGTLSRYH